MKPCLHKRMDYKQGKLGISIEFMIIILHGDFTKTGKGLRIARYHDLSARIELYPVTPVVIRGLCV